MDGAGSKTPLKKFTAFLVILCFSAITTWLLHLVVAYSRNTWEKHEEWVHGKLLMDGWLMGAKPNFFSRVQISRNQLNIKEWHGNHELIVNRILQPRNIQFRVHIKSKAYVSIIYNKTADSFSGIRLSRHPNIPSMYFRSAADGKYKQKEPIQNVNIWGKWYNVDLRFDTNRASLYLDEKLIGNYPYTNLQEQLVGFRAGLYPVIIDDVRIRDSSGHLVIDEDFGNSEVDWRMIVISFLIQILLATILLLKARQLKKAFFSIMVCEFTLIAVLLAYFCFDWYFWSPRYHPAKGLSVQRVKEKEHLHIAERVRIDFFTVFPFYESKKNPGIHQRLAKLEKFLRVKSEELMPPQIQVLRYTKGFTKNDVLQRDKAAAETYLNQFPIQEKVILLLGSSQTFGNGATSLHERFPRIVFEELKHSLPSHDFVIVNGSDAGSHSRLLLEDCKQFLYLFRPNVVLINLANNDPPNFQEGMSGLLDWASAQGAKPVLILEANSAENVRKHIITKHQIMRQLARERNLQVIDLHGHLANWELFESGFLWWDLVHPTSYGQRLAGGYVAEEFVKQVPFP